MTSWTLLRWYHRGDGREIMKLAKVLRIVGYSAVKLATVPLLLSPLHKYMDWCVFSLSMFTAIIFWASSCMYTKNVSFSLLFQLWPRCITLGYTLTCRFWWMPTKWPSMCKWHWRRSNTCEYKSYYNQKDYHAFPRRINLRWSFCQALICNHKWFQFFSWLDKTSLYILENFQPECFYHNFTNLTLQNLWWHISAIACQMLAYFCHHFQIIMLTMLTT